LNILSFVPGLDIPIGLINASIDLYRGESPWLSLATMVPVIGDAATLMKEAKLAQSLTVDAAKGVNLTAEQLKNIGRFEKKLPANAKESLSVRSLPNDGVVVQGTSPGRVPGSSAVYEKQIDAAGNTIQATKTTYDPFGNIVHVKDKLNGGVFP
jgi:gamma-glutamyltranspeptidase